MASLVAAREVLLNADVPQLSKPVDVDAPDLVVWESEHRATPSSEYWKRWAVEKA